LVYQKVRPEKYFFIMHDSCKFLDDDQYPILFQHPAAYLTTGTGSVLKRVSRQCDRVLLLYLYCLYSNKSRIISVLGHKLRRPKGLINLLLIEDFRGHECYSYSGLVGFGRHVSMEEPAVSVLQGESWSQQVPSKHDTYLPNYFNHILQFCNITIL